MRIAAIDQGTTSTRVLLADSNGSAEIVHSVRHRQHHPAPGWVEHSPAELLANINTCIEVAGTIDAIGIDNQGESCLAWDAQTGEPLSPVIVWQDNRTSDSIEELRRQGAEEITLARAGLPLDPYFSASKLGWLIKHNERVSSALSKNRLKLGTTDAYFLDQLTGVYATDVTTASRTSLMNLESAEWDAELCRLFGVPIECLPEIRSTVGDFGQVGAVPITASIVDQQAALYGHGCRKTGDAKVTFGTGAFALTLTGSKIIRAHEQGLLPTVAWKIGEEITYALDGGVYDASSAVEWAGRLGLFTELSDIATFDTPAAISRGLVFVPALSGLACPHWDRSAGALWIGMTAATTNSDLCQALLEGVALCTDEVLSAMQDKVSVTDRLSIDGGLARNVYFTQFLADVLNRTIVTQRFDELTAFGCAELAALGLGSRLPEYRNASTIFSPTQPTAVVAEWKERFSAAVTRSRGWR
jgi:glycerol kinase